ncbi:helix-turn-helix domain-containing protein [[Eubacterium] hominis]|uniref:helix-turn-helix domain-containing protein n=1 Tax=[Eubacterium] hominis TaxID=2764325 RepID=UPI003A4D5E09
MEKNHIGTSSAMQKELRKQEQKKGTIIVNEMRIEARFGRNLRFLRKERCVTQIELAERTGLHQNYISEIEHGKRNITLRVMENIAMALGVQEKEFFNERE